LQIRHSNALKAYANKLQKVIHPNTFQIV
jgi:hypothetical protein